MRGASRPPTALCSSLFGLYPGATGETRKAIEQLRGTLDSLLQGFKDPPALGTHPSHIVGPWFRTPFTPDSFFSFSKAWFHQQLPPSSLLGLHSRPPES